MIRYYQKHASPQKYIGIGIGVLAIITLILRNKLTRFMQYIAVAFISVLVLMSICTMKKLVVTPPQIETFFMGYTISLMHRMIDYRVIKFEYVFLFNVISLALKFSLIGTPPVALLIIMLCLEVFPVFLSFKTHQADRVLFDSLYKSKNQLLKFKNFLIEHLQSQIIIFSQDYSLFHFTNCAFKKAFNSEDIAQIKASLGRLIIEPEEIDKNSHIFNVIGYKKKKPPTLSNLLCLLSKKPDILKEFKEGVVLQAFEVDDKKPTNEVLVSRKSFKKSTSEIFHPMNKEHSEHYLTEILSPRLAKPLVFNEENSNADFKDPDASIDGDSKQRIFKIRLFSLAWDEDEAIALILDDITHERTIVELKVADKNKDLVIAMVSHELRTPLNGMLGLIDIIIKMLTQSDIFPYLEACRNSSLLLLNLVNSILDFSQINNNKLNLIFTKFSLASLLERIKPLFDHFCRLKNLYLEIKIAPDVPKDITTDQERLSQILINLLGNAFKFTFTGGVKIFVSLESNVPCRVKFAVQDTGIGITKTDQEKLFKLFGRIKQQNRKVNSHGVGLGLTISNTLAKLLDSYKHTDIQVESEVDKGSTFSFIVQDFQTNEADNDDADDFDIGESQSQKCDSLLNTSDILEERRRSLPIGEKIASYSTYKKELESQTQSSLVPQKSELPLLPQIIWCLVVDDNPFNLMVAKNLLEGKQYKVKTALNGKEAIKKVQEHQLSKETFRVILMDCQMPVMDGYEATRILRKMMADSEIFPCPILALTANNRDEVHEGLCKQAGMHGQISKPLQINELEQTLKEIEIKKKKPEFHTSKTQPILR